VNRSGGLLLCAHGASRGSEHGRNQKQSETWNAHAHLKSVYLIPLHFLALLDPPYRWRPRRRYSNRLAFRSTHLLK
jgi:hypothetical protein